MEKKNSIPVHKVSSRADLSRLNNELIKRGFVAIDTLKPGLVHELSLIQGDAAEAGAQDMAATFGSGSWCNGPLRQVAWSFDDHGVAPIKISGTDGKELGLGYVPWGAGDNIPSTIPVLAQALPYTAAPLRYIADLTAGLGPKLMYRFEDGRLVEFKDAGAILLERIEALEASENESTKIGIEEDGEFEEPLISIDPIEPDEQESPALKRARAAYEDWKNTWLGYEAKEGDDVTHIPGAKEFLEENNLNLHMSQCMQDDVMLDIYFPTVGFQRGRRGKWNPKIVRVDMLPAHSVRLECMNVHRHTNHIYFSDKWRTKGMGGVKSVNNIDSAGTVMYNAAMPQHTLSDLRYIVESNQHTRIKDRPMWVVCPTYYPSGQKPYYPQPAWWSIFTSKAFDFSSTILYDKAKQRENSTSWGKLLYVSLDWLNDVFSDEGYAGDKDKQQEFIDDLESRIENFLQHRENHGKMMRQWMWTGQDGKDHHSVEIVDVAETTKDAAAAGKDELELSTSPIFLALQVDPRLVGVPMVHSSNGGTALREMHLLKQQQLNVKQRLYLQFLNTVCRFNEWSDRAEFVIAQQTLTTLDNSKTGTVETIAGEKS